VKPIAYARRRRRINAIPPRARSVIVAGSDSGQLQRGIYEKPLKNKAKTPYFIF